MDTLAHHLVHGWQGEVIFPKRSTERVFAWRIMPVDGNDILRGMRHESTLGYSRIDG